MRLLFVADLHYFLKQFDWLLAEAAKYDLAPPLSPTFKWGGCGKVEKANPYQSVRSTKVVPFSR